MGNRWCFLIWICWFWCLCEVLCYGFGVECGGCVVSWLCVCVCFWFVFLWFIVLGYFELVWICGGDWDFGDGEFEDGVDDYVWWEVWEDVVFGMLS